MSELEHHLFRALGHLNLALEEVSIQEPKEEQVRDLERLFEARSIVGLVIASVKYRETKAKGK